MAQEEGLGTEISISVLAIKSLEAKLEVGAPPADEDSDGSSGVLKGVKTL